MPPQPPQSSPSPLPINHPRPRPWPVPSRAALRLLYQLAYISSGTAVGLGVLCAEERRRRIQLVQRVADNGKRIRSSPRYNHGGASRFLARLGAELEVDEGQEDALRGSERDGGGASSPEMPSVVETEYAQLYEPARPRRRKGRDVRPVTLDAQQRRSLHSATGSNHEAGRKDDDFWFQIRREHEKHASGPRADGGSGSASLDGNAAHSNASSSESSIRTLLLQQLSVIDRTNRLQRQHVKTRPIPRNVDKTNSFQERIQKKSKLEKVGKTKRAQTHAQSTSPSTEVDYSRIRTDPKTFDASRPPAIGTVGKASVGRPIEVYLDSSNENASRPATSKWQLGSEAAPSTHSAIQAPSKQIYHNYPETDRGLEAGSPQPGTNTASSIGVKIESEDNLGTSNMGYIPSFASDKSGRTLSPPTGVRSRGQKSPTATMQESSPSSSSSLPDETVAQPYRLFNQQSTSWIATEKCGSKKLADSLTRDSSAIQEETSGQISNEPDLLDRDELARAEYTPRNALRDEEERDNRRVSAQSNSGRSKVASQPISKKTEQLSATRPLPSSNPKEKAAGPILDNALRPSNGRTLIFENLSFHRLFDALDRTDLEKVQDKTDVKPKGDWKARERTSDKILKRTSHETTATNLEGSSEHTPIEHIQLKEGNTPRDDEKSMKSSERALASQDDAAMPRSSRWDITPRSTGPEAIAKQTHKGAGEQMAEKTDEIPWQLRPAPIMSPLPNTAEPVGEELYELPDQQLPPMNPVEVEQGPKKADERPWRLEPQPIMQPSLDTTQPVVDDISERLAEQVAPGNPFEPELRTDQVDEHALPQNADVGLDEADQVHHPLLRNEPIPAPVVASPNSGQIVQQDTSATSFGLSTDADHPPFRYEPIPVPSNASPARGQLAQQDAPATVFELSPDTRGARPNQGTVEKEPETPRNDSPVQADNASSATFLPFFGMVERSDSTTLDSTMQASPGEPSPQTLDQSSYEVDQSNGVASAGDESSLGSVPSEDSVKKFQEALLETAQSDEFSKDMDIADSDPTLATSFATHHVWHRYRRIEGRTGAEDIKSYIPAGVVDHDISNFLEWSEHQQDLAQPERSTERLFVVADRLFKVACDFGSLDHIRTLVKWEIAADQFPERHFVRLCRMADSLASRVDHKELFEFYKNLFDIEAVKEFSTDSNRSRLYRILHVLESALTWILELNGPGRADSLLKTTVRGMPSHIVLETLQYKCRANQELKQLSKRADLFLAVMGSQCLTTKLETPLADVASRRGLPNRTQQFFIVLERLTTAAAEAGDVDRCAKLLCLRPQLPRDVRQSVSVQRQLSSFIQACHARGAYQLLDNTCFESAKVNVHELGWLSEEDRTALALACSLDPNKQENFNIIYHSLESSEIRQSLAEQALCPALTAIWKATQNFPLLCDVYDKHRRLAKKSSTELVRQLDMVFLECAVHANQTEQVVERLSRIHETEKATRQTIALHALVLARRRSWDAIPKLFRLAGPVMPKAPVKERTKLFDTVLRLYANDNNAAATWDLAFILIDEFGVVPSRAMHRALLAAFMLGDRLDLILRWLQYTKSAGLPFSLDSHTAAELFAFHFRRNRTPSIFLIRQCREVLRFCPGFDPAPFYALIKEALAFEARTTTGPLRVILRQNARTRLEKYAALEHTGLIPLPGRAAEGSVAFPTKFSAEAGNIPVESSTVRIHRHFAADANECPGFVTLTPDMATKDTASGVPLLSKRLEAAKSTLPSVSANLDPVALQQRTLQDQPFDPRNYSVLTSQRLPISPSLPAAQPPNMNVPESQASIVVPATDTTEHTLEPVASEPFELEEHLRGSVEESFPTLNAPNENGSQDRVQLTDEASAFHPAVDSERPYEFSRSPEIDGASSIPHSIRSASRQRLRDMISALSIGDNDRVITLYKECLAEHGVPSPPMTLELAIQASLRRNNGHDGEAQSILAEAQRAGLEVSFALEPLLMNRMRKSHLSRRQDYVALRKITLDYYSTLRRNGHKVEANVGVHAAATLIRSMRPERGLALLSELFTSDIAVDTKPDIAMMTLFLRGYTWIMSMQGVAWVVKTVLDHNLQIDQRFMDQLGRTRKTLSTRSGLERVSLKLHRKTAGLPHPSTETREVLQKWMRSCLERKREQRTQNKNFARALVETIITCAGNRQEWERVRKHKVDLPPLLNTELDRWSQTEQGRIATGHDTIRENSIKNPALEDQSVPADLDAQKIKEPPSPPPDSDTDNKIAPAPGFEGVPDYVTEFEGPAQQDPPSRTSDDLAWLEDYREFLKPQPNRPKRARARSDPLHEAL